VSSSTSKRAFWRDRRDAGPLTTLFVKKGNTTFRVRVYGVPAAAKQLAIETPIAQAVAAKW
jgi:hypothetical protein